MIKYGHIRLSTGEELPGIFKVVERYYRVNEKVVTIQDYAPASYDGLGGWVLGVWQRWPAGATLIPLPGTKTQ